MLVLLTTIIALLLADLYSHAHKKLLKCSSCHAFETDYIDELKKHKQQHKGDDQGKPHQENPCHEDYEFLKTKNISNFTKL